MAGRPLTYLLTKLICVSGSYASAIYRALHADAPQYLRQFMPSGKYTRKATIHYTSFPVASP